MNANRRILSIVFCLVITIIVLCSCSKEKVKGEVVITDKEMTIRKVSDYSFVVDGAGKIKNVGKVDVKQVVVTGYCRSCGEAFIGGTWFISDIDKTDIQKDTISYIPVGGEEEFSFKEVAFYFSQAGDSPESLPENIEFVIESFESVDD